MRGRNLFCLGVWLLVVTVASADYLMVNNTTDDCVMLLNGYNGAMVNPTFIDLTPVYDGTAMTSIVAGEEIWVSDQSFDGVMRWSLDGRTYLGTVSCPGALALSSPAGIEVVGNTAYIADRGNDRVVTASISTAAATGSFNAGSGGAGTPYDVLFVNHLGYGDELLVGDAGEDDIDVFTLAGVFKRTFHDADGSSGIDSPQQMSLTADGTILVAGSSSPRGIYEYDAAGIQINYWPRDDGARGVYPLDNGNILFTDGGGVHIIDRASGSVTDVVTGIAARHIEPIVPEPASLLLLLVAATVTARRR